MCGFLFAKTGRGLDKEQVFSVLKRRGPDMEGYLRVGNLHFFHTRLNVLDLSQKGIQPMFDYTKRYLILYNGEIYNFEQLKRKIKNYHFKTKTDTEVVLELFKKYGHKMLNMLRGMFAIFIYDFEKNSIFIARDPLGIKPLYYCKTHRQLAFSSSPLAIIKSGIIKLSITPFAIKEFMCFRQNFYGKTLFVGIKEFFPGHYMSISNGKIIYKKYWDIPKGNVEISKKKILNLIFQSVQRRLVSDVPVGIFLSGGLDSSFLASIMKKTQPNILSIDARVIHQGESKFAIRVANFLKMQHHYTFLDKKLYLKDMDKIIEFTKYPLSVPNEVAISKLSLGLKKRNISVVLSGEGADELFGGYDQLMGSKEICTKRARAEIFIKRYNYFKGLNVQQNKFKTFFDSTDTYKENIYKFFILQHIRSLLKRLDNATMFYSVEGRVPFLDIDLVEYMVQIPPEKRLSKTILKDIAKSFLPNRIINRKKVGFPMPLEDIFEKKQIKKMLKKGRLKEHIPLKQLLSSLNIAENIGYKMWMIYNMEKWLEEIENELKK